MRATRESWVIETEGPDDADSAIGMLALEDGMTVAAIGASPHLASRISEAVGGGGRMLQVETTKHEPQTTQASDLCDRVVIFYGCNEPSTDLRDAARLLRAGGRLILIKRPDPVQGMNRTIEMLSKNGWDIHRHGDVGRSSYFVEAAVSDQSVQS